MTLLPRKALLAITTVLDIALQDQGPPVSAKSLALRNALSPRHLEPVLQDLVRQGILNGIRGPRGGYQIARDLGNITVDDILRATGSENGDRLGSIFPPMTQIVLAAVEPAEKAASSALARINIAELVRRAQPFRGIVGKRQHRRS